MTGDKTNSLSCYKSGDNQTFLHEKRKNSSLSEDLFNRRLREKKNEKMTLIIGARCKDGVVLIADRMVLNSSRLVDKIRTPQNLNVIFSAGGLESVFEDYLDDLSKNVNWMYNWFQEENKKNPESLEREYDFKQFKKTCIDTLTELKRTYRNYGENAGYDNMLQVFFTLPETKDGKTITKLYIMDMEDCLPQVIEDGKIAMIGYKHLASPFMKSLENRKDMTMRDVARVGSFAIKYIEKEGLTEDAVGVGNLEPQIYFIPDGQIPEEIKDYKLKDLLKGVDEEVETIRNIFGSNSSFLRF